MSPILLGILNITADSFSDGGRFLEPGAALAHARRLVAGGAHGLDIGAAASNPNAEPVPPAVEIARLAPIVAALKGSVPLSIDSFATEVQRWALSQGVTWLNDIHGFAEPALYPELAAGTAKLIVMHAVQTEGRARADDVAPESVFGRILEFFKKRLDRLAEAGIARDRIVIDPGMGLFLGRHSAASYEVLRRIGELREAFGLPVLISVSRKSFLRGGRDPAEAGPATLAAELFACAEGADYIRTHDPAALADGLAVWSAALAGNKT